MRRVIKAEISLLHKNGLEGHLAQCAYIPEIRDFPGYQLEMDPSHRNFSVSYILDTMMSIKMTGEFRRYAPTLVEPYLSINQHKSESLSLYQPQSASISTKQNQSTSIRINKNQSLNSMNESLKKWDDHV